MIKKLEVEFNSNINNRDCTDRKYTLTHSDETGQRYLFIGEKFAEDRYNKLKDEVLGQWGKAYTEFELHITCTLYSEHSSLTIEERYEKFKQHMPRAITAIINGDKKYIIENNLLDYNVYVHFLSDIVPSKEHYGKVSDYIVSTRSRI